MKKIKCCYIKVWLSFAIAVTVLLVAVTVFAQGDKPTIYIAGDSLAQKYYPAQYPQTGWGQVIADYFTDEINVDNRAISGRGTKRFISEGRLEKIFETIKPGDFVFIQFGIYETDKNNKEWNADVEEYKECLKNDYIAKVQQRGAIPVILTPCAQALWNEKSTEFEESRVEFANATRELAKEMAVIAVNCLFSAAERLNKKVEPVIIGGDVMDNGISAEYINAVRTAYAYGLINDAETSPFHPKDNLTKAQGVAIMNRIAQRLN